MFEVSIFKNRHDNWAAVVKTTIWKDGELSREEYLELEPRRCLGDLMLDIGDTVQERTQ
jgi:hypothetical protein